MKITKHLEIKIRESSNRDLFEIREVANSSFPIFRERRVLSNANHYRLDYPMKTSYGLMNIAVLENKHENIAAYIYYQYRSGNDMYLMEIAANPPRVKDKTPLAGTILLGYAIDAAIKKGYEQGTLNVVNYQKNTAGRRDDAQSTAQDNPSQNPCSLAKLMHFYRKFGYQEQPDVVGYTSHGGTRSLEDVWMLSSDLKDSLLKINTYLEKYIG